MLLAVDTSTTQVGIALYDGVQVIGESLWHGKLRHTTSLAPEIAALFKRTNRTMDEVTALGVALGPGSFTSLRVGLALVKGLALSRHLPLIGIPTLDILATAQPARDIRLACLLQAGRGRLAVGYYHLSPSGLWESNDELSVMNVDELAASIEASTLICGELSAEEREILEKVDLVELSSPILSTRQPASLAELAWKRWQAKDTDDVASLSPIYLQVGAAIPS
jgi:tRNA threonylcarbamoyladenosine biosynthesis protein TsaB